MSAPIAIVEAPSILGLRPTGVEELPEALRASRSHSNASAIRDAVRVSPLRYDDRRDAETGFLNPPRSSTSRTGSRTTWDASSIAVDRPLVLGGDCTIMLGNLLALARRGRYGLLFFDGHADFYQPEANVNGEAASSELALATGRGPAALTTFRRPPCPLIRRRRRGCDWHARRGRSGGLRQSASASDNAQLRPGRAAAAGNRRKRCTNRSTTWAASRSMGSGSISTVDVLDDGSCRRSTIGCRTACPGARRNGARAGVSCSAVGMDVTIFNPRLDSDGAVARSLTELLVRVLSTQPD